MRQLLKAILFLTCFSSLQVTAGPGSKAAAGPELKVATTALHSNKSANAGAARFQFKNLIAGMEERDSILIIFDRYDHTGAGIVHQVFAADNDQGITVPDIAPGKYYVTVQCIGLHRDHLEKIVTIRPQRSETVRIKLTQSAVYSKNKVVIPAFHPDLSDLAVLRNQPAKHF
jgi:hypothetical protein